MAGQQVSILLTPTAESQTLAEALGEKMRQGRSDSKEKKSSSRRGSKRLHSGGSGSRRGSHSGGSGSRRGSHAGGQSGGSRMGSRRGSACAEAAPLAVQDAVKAITEGNTFWDGKQQMVAVKVPGASRSASRVGSRRGSHVKIAADNDDDVPDLGFGGGSLSLDALEGAGNNRGSQLLAAPGSSGDNGSKKRLSKSQQGSRAGSRRGSACGSKVEEKSATTLQAPFMGGGLLMPDPSNHEELADEEDDDQIIVVPVADVMEALTTGKQKLYWDGNAQMMDVNPISFHSLVDLRADEASSSDGSYDSDLDNIDGGSDDTSSGEEWCNRPEAGAVEVPVWILNKFKTGDKQKKQATAAPAATPAGNSVCATPRDGSSRRVSFAPQKDTGRGSTGFWKIPMPTRSNTYFQHTEDLDKDQADVDQAERDEASDPEKEQEQRKRRERKKSVKEKNSVLQVVGHHEADDGLYAVPTGGDSDQASGSRNSAVVEVRRQSVHLGRDMLKALIGKRAKNIEDDDDDIGEIVLPLFKGQEKNVSRQCKCKKDPATGLVIHTCMTPAATPKGGNTNADTSYVCTEWQTRAHSRRGSSRQPADVPEEHPEPRSKLKKHTEYDSETSDSNEQGSEKQDRDTKRIRNASILHLAGKSSEPDGSPKATSGFSNIPEAEEDEEEVTDENELLVSWSNMPDISGGDPELNVLSPPQDGRQSDQATTPMDEKVETMLAQRFDLIEPEDLYSMIVGKKRQPEVLVVDVRGRDWVGGHIPTSINLRTTEIVKNPSSVLEHCEKNGKTHLVFTCMYSVLRARKCARALEWQQGSTTEPVRLSMLEGGVHAWVNHFAPRQTSEHKANFIDGFDPEMWCDGGPSNGGLVHAMDALWSQGGAKALSMALFSELESLSKTRGDADGDNPEE
eukprot:gnl/TRDRNA2_/TRDRNA2_170069_c0_seq1.p1 gnl/TRDRNA2_/TRDRNA2_170069_c0~~gnl/TRDRNA2_/TRDRNA2_170069_c0_seq1.p1  ORF type:complete len:1010 (-),score=222.29 gnl/TRDRNA2_/TRDRNA2_170069_c0_seq1:137-2854(-)